MLREIQPLSCLPAEIAPISIPSHLIISTTLHICAPHSHKQTGGEACPLRTLLNQAQFKSRHTMFCILSPIISTDEGLISSVFMFSPLLVSFDAVFSKVGRSVSAARAHTVRSLRRMRIRIHPALPPLAIPPAAGDEGERETAGA